MARILLTGFTAKQRGEGRPQVTTLLCGAEIALKHAGHYVERRKVFPDEDLKAQFDVAVVAVYDYKGSSATAQKFNTIRACVDLPHVLAWDDWNAKGIFSSISSGSKQFWRLGLHESDPKVNLQRDVLLRTRGEHVTQLIQSWATAIPKMLCCAFNWGDHSVLKAAHPFGELCCWDPSPWVHGMHDDLGCKQVQRMRRWVLASLWNHDDWLRELDPTWDVLKITKPGKNKRSWQLEEASVYREYCTSMGVLSPPYDQLAGSGWWRNRFVFAADAGSVLYADPSEVAPVMGETSNFYWDLDWLEASPDSQLAQVAEAQARELRGWEKSAADSAKQLEEFVLSVA